MKISKQLLFIVAISSIGIGVSAVVIKKYFVNNTKRNLVIRKHTVGGSMTEKTIAPGKEKEISYDKGRLAQFVIATPKGTLLTLEETTPQDKASPFSLNDTVLIGASYENENDDA